MIFPNFAKNISPHMAHLEINIDKLEMAASKLRAISHPMRIAIIDLLADGNRLSVTEIYEALGIEQATASHHLNILKNRIEKNKQLNN